MMEDKAKSQKKTGAAGKDEPAQNQTNLWNEILREALTKKDLEQSHLFIFGDKNSGKKTIIKNINKDLLNKVDAEDYKRALNPEEKGSSRFALVDYTYLNIKKLNETDSDVIGKINVWIINEVIEKDLFETIFRPEYILKSVCMIVVDLSRPWEIIENLRKWCNYIYESFGSLMLRFPLEKQEEMRSKIEDYTKLFEEVQKDEEGNIKRESPSEETIKLKKSMPIKDGLLKTNLGIPLIFVINKSDIVSASGEKKRFEEDSEFILKHIRNLALSYAATTVYTSTKYNYNLNVLYDYILHRIYNFDMNHITNVSDKDSYFIPSGYDSANVLKGYDLNDDLSKFYADRVPPIKQKGTNSKEIEVTCEDLQAFLNKYRAGKKVTSNSTNFQPMKNEYQSISTVSSNAVSNTETSELSSSNNERASSSNLNGKQNENKSGHGRSLTNSTTDFSKFLRNPQNTGSSTTNLGTTAHNTSNDNNTSQERKMNFESVKKNETSKLIKDEKGDKSKDLMKKIAALRNKSKNDGGQK